MDGETMTCLNFGPMMWQLTQAAAAVHSWLNCISSTLQLQDFSKKNVQCNSGSRAASDSALFGSSALSFVYSPAFPSRVDPEPMSWWARSASKHADSFEGRICGFSLFKLANHKYQCNLGKSACRHARSKNVFNSKAATTFHSFPFI